jgi:LacI family transcriptional regulator
MTVTIYDVAREAKVSLATVSRVVNNNPNVKPTTRQRVLQAIIRLGYRPNAVARGLASKKTTTIGVVIPDISRAVFPDMVRGIEDIALMYRYNIILCNSDQNEAKEIRLINTLLEKQVDGLLFLGERITEEHLHAFRTSVPVVLCGTSAPHGAIPSVDIHHEQAAYDAVQLLIEYGHRSIAMLSGDLHDPLTGYARFHGYKRALADAKIPYRDEWVRTGKYRYRDGFLNTERLLQLPEKPTALFACTDEMAIGAIHAMQDAGLRVPDDISVISIGNITLAEMVRPLLTTVAQQMYDIGAVSMRLLTKLIHDEEIVQPNIILEHHLMMRNSVARLHT